jgi:hypothetical protein
MVPLPTPSHSHSSGFFFLTPPTPQGSHLFIFPLLRVPPHSSGFTSLHLPNPQGSPSTPQGSPLTPLPLLRDPLPLLRVLLPHPSHSSGFPSQSLGFPSHFSGFPYHSSWFTSLYLPTLLCSSLPELPTLEGFTLPHPPARQGFLSLPPLLFFRGSPFLTFSFFRVFPSLPYSPPTRQGSSTLLPHTHQGFPSVVLPSSLSTRQVFTTALSLTPFCHQAPLPLPQLYGIANPPRLQRILPCVGFGCKWRNPPPPPLHI